MNLHSARAGTSRHEQALRASVFLPVGLADER